MLDFVRAYGDLDDKTIALLSESPISNLERLLNDRDVRDALGIQKADGRIMTSFPAEELIKPLAKIVTDIAARRVNVTHIERKADRQNYLQSFRKAQLPNPSTAFDEPRSLDQATASTKAGRKRAGARTKQGSAERKVLVPRDCRLNVTEARLNDIYLELRKLSVDSFPNAAAVLLRVFLELSLDAYLMRKQLMSGQQLERTKLKVKITVVADHLEEAGVMTRRELIPVRKAAANQDVLLSSVDTLHAYVHHAAFNPVPRELKHTWDNWQNFLVKLWA